MTQPLLQAKSIAKTFSQGRLDVPVLFDIDLALQPGEFVAIMGPSGCGKSTLMHILGLMLSPTAGQLWIDGRDVSNIKANGRARLRRKKIGFVFQRFNLLPTVTARQNICVAERIRGHEIDGQIDRILDDVDMTHKAHHKPGQLSIGEQQRIAVARAVVHRPAILMADEPTGNLDSHNAQHVLDLFRQINRDYGITVLMITHSPSAAQAADRILHMTDGRINPDIP